MPSNLKVRGGWVLACGQALLACGLVTGAPENVAQPRFSDGGLIAESRPLDRQSAALLAGFWEPSEGSSWLGSSLVVRQSPGYVSVFGNREATYAVLEAGCLPDGRLVLEGYHRTAIDADVGLVRLFVQPQAAADAFCQEEPYTGPLQLEGAFGQGGALPEERLLLQRKRALPEAPAALVIAHRGGCRTSDNCGASENSLDMLRMAQRLGADRVEIDVQVTADGVPLLYHDPSFGPLLVNGRFCRGDVRDFTWAHVTQLCTLRFGEAVSRLEDALRTVVEETELAGVWLDVKTVTGMNAALPVVRKWNRLAAERGRNLRIVVGLSTEELVDAWRGSTEHDAVDCLVELGVDELRSVGCRVWAPRWTLGPMAETVAKVRAEGIGVTFWTLDEEQFIDLFLEQAKPTGLLTNRPGLALQRAYVAALRSEGAGSR